MDLDRSRSLTDPITDTVRNRMTPGGIGANVVRYRATDALTSPARAAAGWGSYPVEKGDPRTAGRRWALSDHFSGQVRSATRERIRWHCRRRRDHHGLRLKILVN